MSPSLTPPCAVCRPAWRGLSLVALLACTGSEKPSDRPQLNEPADDSAAVEDSPADSSLPEDTDTAPAPDTGGDTGGDTGEPYNPDADGDGWPAHLDCDDEDSSVNPGQQERCDDIDNDCDGEIDEEAIDVIDTWLDEDGDGYAAMKATRSCDELSGSSSPGDDCDDTDAAVHPGAEEVCNAVDDDCDGAKLDGSPCALVDDCPLDVMVVFEDADGALTDLTGDFESASKALPADVSINEPGTLYLCHGDWHARIVGDAEEVFVVGLEGSKVTRLSLASTVSGAIITAESGTLRVEGLSLEDSPTASAASDDATLVLVDSVLSNNQLGVDCQGSALLLDGSDVRDNVEGLRCDGDGTVEITDTNVLGNDYGVVQSGGGEIQISGSSFYGNVSAVYTELGAVSALDSSFNSNVTVGGFPWGAAISSDAGDITVDGCTFSRNQAAGDTTARGGAIYSDTGDIFLSSSLFERNLAGAFKSGGEGGAIYSEDGDVTLDEVELDANRAVTGGALYLVTGDLVVTGSSIHDNEAGSSAGGAWMGTGHLTSTDSAWADNLPEDVWFFKAGSVTIGSDDYSGP